MYQKNISESSKFICQDLYCFYFRQFKSQSGKLKLGSEVAMELSLVT